MKINLYHDKRHRGAVKKFEEDMLENGLLMNILREKMRYTSERHGVIASNIANISTPLAKTKDLTSFDKVLNRQFNLSLPLSMTSVGHISKQNTEYSYPIVYPMDGTEPKLNGNNISLSNESTKLNRNNIEYQKIMSIYSKVLSMFHIATGR